MKKQLMVTALVSSLAITGCATDPNTGQTTINKAAIGAISGALGGTAISKATGGDKTGRDAAIGAAIGGAVGYYMDRQEKQLQEQLEGTGVDVSRDEQGNIDLVMPNNITFGFDQSSINPQFYSTLNKVAQTMAEFDQTSLDVVGHTDSKGDAAYNQNLSQRRAQSVAQYLANQGVAPSRIRTYGYGETRPIASNDTEYGRAQNRRVEIQITAPQQIR